MIYHIFYCGTGTPEANITSHEKQGVVGVKPTGSLFVTTKLTKDVTDFEILDRETLGAGTAFCSYFYF